MKRTIAYLLSVLILLPAPSWAAFSLSATQTYSNAAPGTATPAMAAVNVPSGALLVLCAKSEYSTGTLSSVAGTGGDTFTMHTNQSHSGTHPHNRCASMLAATANAAYVATMTFATSFVAYVKATLFVFTYTGTASFDVEVGSTQDTTDTTPSSDTLTTNGYDEVCIASHADFAAQTFTASSETINGAPADGVSSFSDTDIFYKIFSAPFSGGVSTLTRSVQPKEWIQRLTCFKTDAGGGGGATPRNLTMMGMGN